MRKSEELYAEAKVLDEKSSELKRQAQVAHQEELLQIPKPDRLVYAAYTRCPCGAGMAYDPAGDSGKPFGGYWDCSAILLETADESAKHEARLPFAFYEIKSENQPSVNDATTRPAKQS